MPASTLGSAFAIPSLTLSQEHDLLSRGLHEILSLLLFLSTFCKGLVRILLTFHKFSCFCWHLFCQHRDSRAAETSATPVCANQHCWVWLSGLLMSSFTRLWAVFRQAIVSSIPPWAVVPWSVTFQFFTTKVCTSLTLNALCLCLLRGDGWHSIRQGLYHS